jgi:hypothetical protein
MDIFSFRACVSSACAGAHKNISSRGVHGAEISGYTFLMIECGWVDVQIKTHIRVDASQIKTHIRVDASILTLSCLVCICRALQSAYREYREKKLQVHKAIHKTAALPLDGMVKDIIII